MIIEARDLKKRFGRHDAVHGMNLTLPEGAALALIGPNGAGKTTTLSMLMKLIRPDGGEATVLGVDSRKLTYREFEQIGYVSENQKLVSGIPPEWLLRTDRIGSPKWARVAVRTASFTSAR